MPKRIGPVGFEIESRKLDHKMKKRSERLRQLLKDYDPTLVRCQGRSLAGEFAPLLTIEWLPVCRGVCASQNRKCVLLRFLGQDGIGHNRVQVMLDGGLPAERR
jgi:hypothetical protein